MEERLQYLLSSVNDWLKFAESKNAALLAANVAIAFGLLTLFQSKPAVLHEIVMARVVILGLFILASVVCMASFFPKLEILPRTKTTAVSPKDSLIFYGHVFKFNPEDYLKDLYKRVGDDAKAISNLERDYAEQIIVNSGIALWKYQCFRIALIFTMVAILGSSVVLVLF